MNTKSIYYIMGVSGCGKSTIGKRLAEELTIPFFDGDDYHPEANTMKMAAGNPLNDSDRQGWLIRLNMLAKENIKQGAVIVCSALKESYRNILEKNIEAKVVWIYLYGSFECIYERLQERKGHFMPPSLLRSQFNTLEIPQKAIHVPITKTPKKIITMITKQLEGKN